MMAVGTTGWDFFLMTAGVANEGIRVRMEREGQETIGAKSLPTAVFADGHGSRAATVVIDEGLVAIFKVFLNSG